MGRSGHMPRGAVVPWANRSGAVSRRTSTKTLGSFGGLWLALLALAACAAPATAASNTITNAEQWAIHGAAPPLPRQLSLDDQAAQLVAHMSLDDKLGQMIIIQYTDTTYTPQQQAMVKPFHPGGVILYSYAMGTEDQVHSLLAAGQVDSPIPMFTLTDEEGGYVDRLNPYLGWRLSAPQMAATGNPQVAENEGLKTAHDMLSFGFNADLAPMTDVAVVMGPDQWGRTFGTTPQPVITYAGAYLQGLQDGGVVGTLKHFPGLGAATTDAHTDLPVINRTRAQIESTELAPYRALIATGQVHMIMSTDLLMPALDPTMPAELSKPIITGILRDELHFDGIVMTDALYMAGISDHWSFSTAAALAIEAGSDMIMAPWTPTMIQNIITGLKDAITSGQLTMAQVDTSVRRILATKMLFHLIPSAPRAGAGLQAGLPPAGQASARAAAQPSADLPRQRVA
jgi:beta-N-acetylhexosaminidase